MIKPAPRMLRALILAGITWALLALVLVPRLIRDAHAGRSVSLLNGLMEGRDAVPLESYLAVWRGVALRLTVAGALVVTLLLVVRQFLPSLGQRISRILRAAPVICTSETIVLGAWLGFANGLLEAAAGLIRQAITGNPGPDAFGFSHLWMAPLGTALLGASAGAVLGLALRAGRGIALWLPVALLGTIGLYSIFISLRLHVSRPALLLLSVGIAVQLARLSLRHGAGFRGLVRRTSPILVAVVPLIAVGGWGIGRLRERSALTALGPATAGAPNVLLLILDTVRAAELSLYGYARSTTPEIDRWAGGGVTFDRAIAPSPWTLPSHASLFTGRPPHELSAEFGRRLDGDSPTLAEVLGRRGYASGGFVANLAYVSRAGGLARGFTVYRDFPMSWDNLLNSSRLTRILATRLRRMFGEYGELGRKTAEDVNREFLAWRPPAGRPFFAFLNYLDAHAPYETHPPFEVRFSKRPPRYWLLDMGRGHSREELGEFIDGYDSAIAYLDHQIGRLLEELNRRGVLDNTIVIITSDHGEQFGEHNLISHANSLYMPLLAVPLVIRYPSRVPAGRRVAEPVELRDIPATVLDLLAGDSPRALPGQSLARYWVTDSAGVRPFNGGPGLLSELIYHRDRFVIPEAPIRRGSMQSILRGDLHYIRNGDGVEELYDLSTDPEEVHDLAASGHAELAQLRRALGILAPRRRRRSGPGFPPTPCR